ncbi:MAG: hypothetical protein P8M21_13485 [Halioglobus sp.]|nr:hypothetical protein [Halioglobus sp.]
MIFFGKNHPGALAMVLMLLLTHWAQPACGQTSSAHTRVEAALQALDATDLDEDWYFAMEVVDGDELQQIESDPTRPPYERRTLLTVNGEAPDADRLAQFADAEKKRIDDQRDGPRGYVPMVDIATLELLAAPAGDEIYAFVPQVQKLEEDREHLRGELLMDAQSGWIRQLQIYNTEKLSPAFSVSVDTFRLTLDFNEVHGENLIQSLQSHTVGKAGFLKSFDSKVHIRFSDFRRR